PSKTLTDGLVRRPANIKVKPKARTRGHAVDAGTSISTGAPGLCSAFFTDTSVAIFSSSAAQNVNNSENYNPHGIHEMPVQGEHVEPNSLHRYDASCKSHNKH